MQLVRRAYAGLVRWGFARFYHEFAWIYDTVAWLVSRGYWRHWALSAQHHLAPGRVLELGCGTGNLQLALAAAGQAHIGLDESLPMLAISQRKLRGHGYSAPLVRALAQALPLCTSSVGTVVATFPTAYILHPATLAETRRVLQPNGRLLIVDAAQLHAGGYYEWLIDLAFRLTLQGSIREQPVVADPRVTLLEQAGFVVRHVWEKVGASRVMVLIAE